MDDNVPGCHTSMACSRSTSTLEWKIVRHVYCAIPIVHIMGNGCPNVMGNGGG